MIPGDVEPIGHVSPLPRIEPKPVAESAHIDNGLGPSIADQLYRARLWDLLKRSCEGS
jgi:hypothetical protein